MLKRYTFWFSAAILFQLITGSFHAVSLFIKPEATNDTERELFSLLIGYKINAGAGFHPTYSDLFTALSSCFTLLCIFAGAVNGFLLFKHTEPNVMRGIVYINLVIFSALFVIMAVFSFLPPIVCTGLIFINLLAAALTVPKIDISTDL